jgi:hypothetical protein
VIPSAWKNPLNRGMKDVVHGCGEFGMDLHFVLDLVQPGLDLVHRRSNDPMLEELWGFELRP